LPVYCDLGGTEFEPSVGGFKDFELVALSENTP